LLGELLSPNIGTPLWAEIGEDKRAGLAVVIPQICPRDGGGPALLDVIPGGYLMNVNGGNVWVQCIPP